MKYQKIHNRQKKIAVLNDLTGFGRCSVAVSLPIISSLGIQCCFAPTAILSSQTGFPHYYIEDFTGQFRPYTKEWEALGLYFDGIATGFLNSAEQTRMAAEFIRTFADENTIVLCDPVLGDQGKRFPGFDDERVEAMKALMGSADLITPNLTEACILTDTPFPTPGDSQDGQPSLEWNWLLEIAERLSEYGPEKIVITGIEERDRIGNFCFDKGTAELLWSRRIGPSRNGTGDILASVLIGDAVKGKDLVSSVRHASGFLESSLRRSEELGIPPEDGVAFEEELSLLQDR